MKRLIAIATVLCTTQVFAQRATLEAPILNGDFSSTTIRNNGTLNGRAPFLPGASSWQAPNSYSVGVQNGTLSMYETFPINSIYKATVNKAQQQFDAEVANYFVTFDYRIVGNDPYVYGTSLYVKVGTTDYQVPWDETQGWVTGKFRTYLAQPSNLIEIGTTKAPKLVYPGSYNSTAYAQVDNVRVWRYAPTPSVPEPETYAMLLAGLAVLAVKRKEV